VIDHFEIKTKHFRECQFFYSTVLQPLGIELKWSDNLAAGFGLANEGKVRFLIEQSGSSTSSHIAFIAINKSAVEQFYAAGIENGFKGNGEPGIRENYSPDYFAAFLIDPDGNNVEAVVYV